ncbi:MAG: hypothetical protein RI959_659 [Pseudomonadota bacterium]
MNATARLLPLAFDPIRRCSRFTHARRRFAATGPPE